MFLVIYGMYVLVYRYDTLKVLSLKDFQIFFSIQFVVYPYPHTSVYTVTKKYTKILFIAYEGPDNYK